MDTKFLARGISAFLVPIVATAAAVLAWHLLTLLPGVPAFLVPPPLLVAEELLARPGFYVMHLLASLEIVAYAFAIAAIGSMLAALAFDTWPLARRLLHPYVLALQILPVTAIAPLLVLWLGIGITAKVVIVALIAFFPIFVGMQKGLQAADPLALELFRSLDARWTDTMLKLRIPASLPHLFPGLLVGYTLCLSGAIVAEFIASNEGIGYLILLSLRIYDSTMMFAGIVTLIAGAGLIYMLLSALERAVVFWQR